MRRKLLVAILACMAAVCLGIGLVACTDKEPPCEHNYVLRSDENNHWYECELCGDKSEPEPHDPAESGFYGNNYDENSHWSVCLTCEQPCNIQPHEFTEGHWQEGDTDSWEQVLRCDECNYEKVRKAEPTYTLKNDNTYELTDIGFSKLTSFTVPAEYNGKPVTGIGSYAITSNCSLETLVISDGITEIAEYAIVSSRLRHITLSETLESIGDYDSIGIRCESLEYNEYGNGKYIGTESNPYFLLAGGSGKIELHKDVKWIGSVNNRTEGFEEVEFNTYMNGLYLGTADNPYYAIVGEEGVTEEIHDGTVMIFRYDYWSVDMPMIPASVEYISSLFFQNCSGNNKYWTVSINNKTYSSSNGSLYNKDKTLLYLARYEYDETNDIPSYTLPASVNEISEYALWNGIRVENHIGDNKNFVLENGLLYDLQKNTVYAHNGAEAYGEIVIPATVTKIIGVGTFDFNAEYISVEEGNQNYSSLNGALYNADKTILFGIPALYKGELELAATLERIECETDAEGITAFALDESNKNFVVISGALFTVTESEYSSDGGVTWVTFGSYDPIAVPKGAAGILVIPGALSGGYDDILNYDDCSFALIYVSDPSEESAIYYEDSYKGIPVVNLIDESKYAIQNDVLYVLNENEAIAVEYRGEDGDAVIQEKVEIGGAQYNVTNALLAYAEHGIKTLTIPKTVTAVFELDRVRSSLRATEAYTVDSENTDYMSVDGVLYNKYNGVAASPLDIPDNLTGNITIPDIGGLNGESFSGTDISGITLPSYIPFNRGDFADCENLVSITVPADFDGYLDDDVFTDIAAERTLYIDGDIGAWFKNDNLARFADGAHADKVMFKGEDGNYFEVTGTFEIPDGITDVYGDNLKHFSGMTELIVPEGIEVSGDLSGLKNLTTIKLEAEEWLNHAPILPANVQVIFGYNTIYVTTNDLFEYQLKGDEATLTVYKGSDTTVVVPSEIDGNSVVAIGSEVFADNAEIIAVAISDGITTIADGAFANCTLLETVYIPSSVADMGSKVFENNPALSDDGGTGIGIATGATNTQVNSWPMDWMNDRDYPVTKNAAFSEEHLMLYSVSSGAAGIAFYFGKESNVTVPSTLGGYTVTQIGIVFAGNTNLVSITLSEGVEIISPRAFSGCTNLTTVVLPDTLEAISWEAFRDCTSLKAITLPDSVMLIGERVFQGCTSLVSVEFAFKGAWVRYMQDEYGQPIQSTVAQISAPVSADAFAQWLTKDYVEYAFISSSYSGS